MKIFSWNVNSLLPTVRNLNLKYGSLEAFFAHLDADIVCMQEVKLPDSKLTKEVVVVAGYQSYWACSQSKTGYSGVTTWARHSCAAVSAAADPFSCEGCEGEGRAVVTDHGAFVLFNVYVPNAGDRPARARLGAKLSFLSGLKQQVDELLGAGRQVVLVGDLNIASGPHDVHPSMDWQGMYEAAEHSALRGLMGPEGSGLIDTWRHTHPDTTDVFTVWDERTSARAFNRGVRIDYACVSHGLMSQLVLCEVLLDLPPKWSDHAPVLLELDIPPPQAHAAAAPEAEGHQPAQQLVTGTGSQQQAQQPLQQQPSQQPSQQPPVCSMWQQLLRRFQDPSQRSIASMFKAAAKQQPTTKQKPPTQQAAAGAGASGQQSLEKGPTSSTPAAAASADGPMSAAAQTGEGGCTAGPAGGKQPVGAEHMQGSHTPLPQQVEQQQQVEEQQQQQQQQERAAGAQARAGPSRSSSGGSRQQKRKASSKADASAGKDAKQAKLQDFFGRSAKQ